MLGRDVLVDDLPNTPRITTQNCHLSKLRIVAPWGFYGMGNIGDEGTLCGFARLLALHDVHPHVTVASSNPIHDSHVEPAFSYYSTYGKDPRRWWAKMRGTAHAVIGGTAIMDVLGEWPLSEIAPLVRASDRRRVPFVFIGSGVEGLRLNRSRQIVREELAPRVVHWSVRSDRDRARLTDYGVAPSAITTAADLAWLIEPVPPAFGRACLGRLGLDVERPLFGVNLANENSCLDVHPAMASALAAALDELVDAHGATAVFLCSEVREEDGFDKAAAGRIIARMKRADRTVMVPNEYYAPRELMSLIGCFQLTVSMRYHVCLFSATQGVPFIAIERADKVADLCWDLQWPARVKPPAFTSSELVGHARSLVGDREAACAYLSQRAQAMRMRASLNLAALEALDAHTSDRAECSGDSR
jgi:polysaccharide pyruvyl transferase WcaK-like protein